MTTGFCKRGDVIQVIRSIEEIQTRSDTLRRQGKTIVFVPTMGFLHEGHLSLLEQGRGLGDDLVLSIFVNPTQFGEGEDLDSYPQNMEKDLDLARGVGVDAVFTPAKEDIYGKWYQTYVTLEQLPHHLCGLSRPVHFRGVATVVTKLFNMVKPHIAIFGEKDFQQLAVIRQMVRDLNYDIDIRGAAIVREQDGLAMSSRNAYLTDEQRPVARCLYASLQEAKEMVKKGEKNAAAIMDSVTSYIHSHPGTNVDYVSICDPETLEDADRVDRPLLMAIAVQIGKCRLIDNVILSP